MWAMPAGIRIQIQRSSSPASRSSTRCRPEAVSRLARTQPAEPAPTMTKSYSPLFVAISHPILSQINERCGDERRGDVHCGDERCGDERCGDERGSDELRGKVQPGHMACQPLSDPRCGSSWIRVGVIETCWRGKRP